ncbi:hypothetical protein [Trinickia acidisoli]|uniref:hypothetical protein n=1 Tax=Trinickia acidisoli TaxID=2767482 RepID=UPI001A90A27B|nr:hypothetical protein [Trinickia acidisoli]
MTKDFLAGLRSGLFNPVVYHAPPSTGYAGYGSASAAYAGHHVHAAGYRGHRAYAIGYPVGYA